MNSQINPEPARSATQEPRPSTLQHVLRWRAALEPSRLAYRYLPDTAGSITEAGSQCASYGELYAAAAAIATGLGARLEARTAGARIVLVCPPGLDFVEALYGCLEAGAVAVPLQPPGNHRDPSRAVEIVRDAAPAAVLTLARLRPAVERLVAPLSGTPGGAPPVLDLDAVAAEGTRRPAAAAPVSPGSLALIQYTSGSTRRPRGVRLTHGNLAHNLAAIEASFGHDADSRGVVWLPPYHDMGLIGGILQPLFAGFPVTLLSPAAFLRRPLRWLQAISHFRATSSGAPNFGYEQCLRRVSAAERRTLDLSSWKVAFNGAEPVRPETLERFAAAFAECGFDPAAFMPCYGLAEATLLASCGRAHRPGATLALERAALRERRVVPAPNANGSAQSGAGRNAGSGVQRVASCGLPAPDTQVRIVDPASGEETEAGRVGEIWLAGPSIAPGYWQAEDETRASFGARLEGDDRRYLRTGDLGFLRAGELFVTGRLGDVIIVRGVNHSPEAIEQSVERAHPRFLPATTAAVGAATDHAQSVTIVQELDRGKWSAAQLDESLSAIRAAVSREHGLQAGMIVLVKPGSLPRTPSGKVQRHRCRQHLAEDGLPVVARWLAPGGTEVDDAAGASRPHAAGAGADRSAELLAWLREYAETSINSHLMDERRSLTPAIVLDFGNRGLLGMQVPARYGGLELSHRASHRVIAQLGAIDATLALFVGLNNVLGIRPILNFAKPALRDDLLPLLATGRELAAFALTEAGAGSHPHAMAAAAVAQPGGGWSLSGTKLWSGSAAWAGVINVFARLCDADGQVTGIGAFAVRRGTPGLRQGPEALTMGMRAMVQNSVVLDAVRVGEAELLGAANEGMHVAQDAMMYGRMVIASACVGGMQRCAQLMLRYASRRSIATGLLLDEPVMRSRLGETVAAITAIRTLLEVLIARLDGGLEVPEEAYSACKILAPELYWRSADWLVQCLGGRGYIEANPAPQILRDARVLRIFEGPTETLAAYLGACLAHRPAALLHFVGQTLGAPGVAAALQENAERLARESEARRRQAGVAAGTLAAWALLRAALEGCRDSDVLSLAWTRQGYERAQSRLQAALVGEPVGAADLRVHIDAYSIDIGDVEQRLAGEDHALDPWLRRAPAPQPRTRDAGDVPDSPPQSGPVQTPVSAAPPAQGAGEIERWLVAWLAQRLQCGESEIDPGRAFADYGVDSVMAVELAQDIETRFRLARALDATTAWSHPTIRALAAHIAGLDNAAQAAVPGGAGLERMSDAELAAVLRAELAMPAS